MNLKQIDCEFHQITFQKKINISFPSIFWDLWISKYFSFELRRKMFRLKIEEVQRFMAVFKRKKFLKHGYVTIVVRLKRCCWVAVTIETLRFNIWHQISYHMGLGQCLNDHIILNIWNSTLNSKWSYVWKLLQGNLKKINKSMIPYKTFQRSISECLEIQRSITHA